jgi:hypothetical protein
VNDPVFLDVEDVLLLHEEQLARYGGAAGVRDRGLLESAVAMPRSSGGGEFVHRDVFAKPARCQLTTVAGCTMTTASDHLAHTRRSSTQNTRSTRRIQGRRFSNTVESC